MAREVIGYEYSTIVDSRNACILLSIFLLLRKALFRHVTMVLFFLLYSRFSRVLRADLVPIHNSDFNPQIFSLLDYAETGVATRAITYVVIVETNME